MTMEEAQTLQLLRRWRAGEREALDKLLERDLPWIRERVQLRLGKELRKRDESQDFVQDAVLEVLRYAPRFEMTDRDHFRGLMARIVENVLRCRHHWSQALRRSIDRERPLASDSVLNLDPPVAEVESPSVEVQNAEQESLLRLALELLEPEDRDVLVLREWKSLSFAEIAAELGGSEDAARMRFQRTLPRLAEKMRLLETRQLGPLLADDTGS